jgi:hypothetical protein
MYGISFDSEASAYSKWIDMLQVGLATDDPEVAAAKDHLRSSKQDLLRQRAEV